MTSIFCPKLRVENHLIFYGQTHNILLPMHVSVLKILHHYVWQQKNLYSRLQWLCKYVFTIKNGMYVCSQKSRKKIFALNFGYTIDNRNFQSSVSSLNFILDKGF